MTLLKTESFELATYSAGDQGAEKLVLILPGRLDTKDYAHMRSHVDFLAEKGYYALSFDPPGTWESPGDISLYTAPNYLRAVDEIITLLGNKPTIIMGHSRGGTTAMVAGIRNPHITHIITVMSAFEPSEPRDDVVASGVYTSYRDLPPGTERTPDSERKRFDLPVSYFDDPTEYTGLDTCTKPKLFFYGTEDVLITPDDVGATYTKAADPKQLHELKSEHDYRLHPEIIKEVNDVTAEFLSQ